MCRWRIRSAPGWATRWRRRRAALGLPVTRGGTYLVMEGPQFSTKAESELYRSWGCSVIGMTNMPEAKLAREAELCYATVAMVTDYDCWHPDHDHVTVEAVVKVLLDNADRARALVPRGAGDRRAARPVPRRLRPRAGQRGHHRDAYARSGVGGAAGRGRRARAGRLRGRGEKKGQGALPPGPPPGNKSPGPLSLWLRAGWGGSGPGGAVVGARPRSRSRPPRHPDPTHPHPAQSQNGRVPRAAPLAGGPGAAHPPGLASPPPTSAAGAWRGAPPGLRAAPRRHPWRPAFCHFRSVPWPTS